MSGVTFLSLFGLLRMRAALVAGAIGLVRLSLFFSAVYRGEYRHEALWLVFLVTLYWIECRRSAARPSAPLGQGSQALSAAGVFAFVLLLVLQLPGTASAIADISPAVPPYSNSARLAAFVRSQPALKDAVLVADPDFMLEAPAVQSLGNWSVIDRRRQ
jgi:hypothetical protein